jgi:hypothetical protein
LLVAWHVGRAITRVAQQLLELPLEGHALLLDLN